VKVLFDVNVPRPLRRLLNGHEIVTAQEKGWNELENGDLIAAAGAEFDVLVTSDQNLKYQQNLSERRIAIIVLPTNFMPAIQQMAPKIQAALDEVKAGDFIEL
jgi:predicted nuclease of predicted toxin-antitoxin system